MSNSSSKIGRWIAAGLAIAVLLSVFYNVVIDNTPKGEVRKIEGYTPWDEETLKIMMTAAGLQRVEFFNLAAGVVAVHRGVKL